jgi:DNA-binding GntR family transcriptional regulator
MVLEQLGVLEVRPNSGFYVLPVTTKDITELYPIIGSLERLALQLTPAEAFGDMLDDLRALIDAQELVPSPPRDAQDLDDRFHALLISKCGNERLVALVNQLKHAVHRYETGYMSDSESVAKSAEQHRKVVRALESGDTAAAADSVTANWQSGMEQLLAWHEGQ